MTYVENIKTFQESLMIKKHLFETENFSYNTNVFTVTFDQFNASLTKQKFFF